MDGLEPRCNLVPLECAIVDRPFPWQVPKPVAVRGGAVLWGELHCGDGVVRGSVRGLFCVVGGDGAWGIWSSVCCGAFASCSSALMVAETSGRVGEAGGWGAGSFQVMWYSSGFSGFCCIMMAAHGVVFRCPSAWIVVEGVEGDGVAVFPAVEC